MANENRSDRQLMRQRGAGSRNIQNADFGFNFGTEVSRDDRQLMRQRGAGNRKIGNVDFGFSFPTPSSSRRSSRTPQVTRRSAERYSKTPASSRARRSSTVLSARGAIQADTTISSRQRLSNTPQPPVQVEQPNSSKRRRLSKDHASDSAQNITINIPSGSEQPTATSEFMLTEEDGSTNPLAIVDEVDENFGGPSTSDHGRTESPLFFPEDENKENEVETRKQNESASKRTNTRAIPELSITDYDGAVPEDSVAQSIEGPERTQVEGVDDIHIPEITDQQEILASTLKKTKKKKRKSITLPRKKRRSSEIARRNLLHGATVDPVVETVGGTRSEIEEESNGTVPTTLGQATELERSSGQSLPLWKKLIAKRAQRRGRMSVSMSPAPVEASEEDEDEDETYVEEEDSPEPVTPAVKQKARSQQFKKNSKLRSNDGKIQKTSRTKFPVIAHRIVNTQALPTIAEESDCETDEDVATLPDTFVNRTQPNAVDVLAQLCRETIQSAIRRLETDPTAAKGRAEIKNKRTALEAFGENLDQRLFDMSQAAEHRMTLEARLRKSKREKADLQARWMEVQRQRDELALKADNIRRENWENEEECKQQWQISELAHKTELELEHEHSDNDELDFMLKSVASNVSSRSGQGGILNRVKSFNSRLERIATMLEGR